MSMYHVILSSLAFLALQYFSTLSQTTQFWKKVSECEMCVLIYLQLLCETSLILRRTERDMIINVYKYLLFCSDFNESYVFLADFLKILKHQIS